MKFIALIAVMLLGMLVVSGCGQSEPNTDPNLPQGDDLDQQVEDPGLDDTQVEEEFDDVLVGDEDEVELGELI
jgi:hypothetical protein